MAFLGVFWYQFKTFIWKKYSKSKQTKFLGLVELGVQWAERDMLIDSYSQDPITNSEITNPEFSRIL